MRLRLLSGLTLAGSLAFSGCATTSSDAPPPAAAGTTDSQAGGGAPAEDDASASVKDFHRHHHRAGITAFIDLGLDTLGADDAKKPQIEKIQDDLKAKMAPVHEAEKALLQTIADGIAAGALDTAKVDAAVTAVATAASGVHDATTDALNQLHALLSPAERVALAEKVQAHWEVWRHVNHEAEIGGKEKGGRLNRLTEEVGLTPEQVEKISSALHDAAAKAPKFDPAEAEAHIQAFTTAFSADTFDAKSLNGAGLTSGKMVTHGARRMVHFYEIVTPLLTPEQRTKLADHLHSRGQPAAASPA